MLKKILYLKDLITVIEDWAPPNSAEHFDNVGLIVGDVNQKITKALITIDTLETVVDEAIEKKCNLIISFHPIIFNGLKKLTQKTYVERVVRKAIKYEICIYSIHTNLDNHLYGVNHMISKKLSIRDTKFLIPKNESNSGSGMIGKLSTKINEQEFLGYVKEKMNTSFIKHSPLLNKKIHTVAVLGGSGSFAIEHALDKNADCLITADLKYHDYFKAENKILLLDIGHFESEQFTKELILNFLNKKIPKFACIISKSKTNPVNYY